MQGEDPSPRPFRPVRSAPADSLVRPLCHEIGNLLAAIRLSAHLLEGEQHPSAAEPERTCREIQSLAAQAGALLAQMRPLLEGSRDARTRVTTASLLASVARAVEGEVPRGVRLQVARGRGLPDVRIDTEALHDLLVALLRDACEASPERGHVRLEAEARDDRVVLRLRDRAPAFELPGERPDLLRGRALLLQLAACVLKASQGRLRVSTSAREGNCVEFELPAARPQVAPRTAHRARG